MSHDFFETSVEYLKGVGPKRADVFKKELEVFTFGDLLVYYPFRYVDRSKFYKVADICDNLPFIQLKGKIINLQSIGGKRTIRMTAVFRDDTGDIELVWFNGFKWVREKLQMGGEFIVFGKPTIFNNKFNIAHPEIEPVSTFEQSPVTTVLQPFYNSSEKLKSIGLDSRGIGRVVKNLVASSRGNIPETLPDDILDNLKLLGREEALQNIHFPENPDKLQKALQRLKFEELFYIQIKLLQLKFIRISKPNGYLFGTVGKCLNDFYHNNLPFELTTAQKRVIKEIRADMGSGNQMNRLLQGDVGSGKTLVALMSMLITIDNGFQACLMVPTEILAGQHYQTLLRMLEGLDLNVAVLTGSTRSKQRKVIHGQLADGRLNILVGTHALIEDTVQFSKLGLVVIDEQHRFGVAQRARLWEKSQGTPPHILVMTATPIPRTLAMTLYGDLEVSVIDEMPPGRTPIKTWHFFDNARLKVFAFIKDRIAEGRQIFVVYPLINESEALDLKDLMDGYESISRAFPPPEYAVCVVHGQMKSKDKDYEMQRFVKGQAQIMVATTVIEVGLDIPNATVMIIENAERFGLSQLHQLRGRVGRGANQSHCILMTSHKLTSEGKQRIATMVRTTDGFEIAETDLKLRGPGDIQGLQQSGVIDLKLADLVRDEKMLHYARGVAIDILKDDPTLEKPNNQRLACQLKKLQRLRGNWARIS
jgi:ATP-dependent DNA helicase RecG